MYLCLNCKSLIEDEELASYSETGEAWGSPYTVSTACCPYCKSDEVKENDLICSSCHQYISGKYIDADGNLYCEDCYAELDAAETLSDPYHNY